ncbi:MAG TPA: tetratricopeptide repeat protein [Miltoncostaeaceae bacterium]|nr:tetratricopeptide repeat protein [Miltoncostaeaceae bacterium]
MLLDQKRTKRLVKVAAILTSVAFAGVALVIIAVIVFGGTTSATGQQVSDARAQVEEQPDNAAAWDRLAAAYQADGQTEEALQAARRAVQLSPREYIRTSTLVRLYVESGRPDQAIAVLQQFTRRNPDDATAFLQLGRLAQEDGRIPLARLSYQAYLRLAPDDVNADAVRQQLQMLEQGGAPIAP